MRWCRRIVLLVAIVMFAAWVRSGFGYITGVAFSHFSIFMNSEGVNLRWDEQPSKVVDGGVVTSFKLPGYWFEDCWRLPIFENQTGATSVSADPQTGRISYIGPAQTVAKYVFLLIPHWLTNLIAWSIFFLLWRRSRKPTKGLCQQCGYNLTGNESGRCPECNHRIEPIVDIA